MCCFSGCFQDFFFVFSFQKFNYDVSLAWISLDFSSLGIIQFLESVDLYLFPNLRSFRHYFFQMLFQCYSPSRLWVSDDIYVNPFVTVLQVLEMLSFLKSILLLLLLLFLTLGKFYWFVFRFFEFILCYVHPTIEFIQQVLHFDYCIFSVL